MANKPMKSNTGVGKVASGDFQNDAPVPQVRLAAVDDLVPNPANARTHPEEQVAQIAASIREFGFANPLLVDRDAGGVIVAGHGRRLAVLHLRAGGETIRLTAWPLSSFQAIMGRVLVPTAAGTWKPGCEVTVRCTGVAPDVLLYSELAELLPVNEDPAAAEVGAADETSDVDQAVWSEEDCSQSLTAVLTRLRAQVPEQALALFAAIVADRDLFERLARDHLVLPQAQILAIQNRLSEVVRQLTKGTAYTRDDFSQLRRRDVRLRFTLTRGGQVKIRTLDGVFRNAPSAIQAPFQVLGEGHEQPHSLMTQFGDAV